MTTTANATDFIGALRPWMAQCEDVLAAVAGGHGTGVSGPATDTLVAGGKRVRPMLLFCASSRREEDRAALVSAAAAVELVHMATLVHDDLIDGATTRRGCPTVVCAHGAGAAVQVGDFLFARAFAELTRLGSPTAVAALADAALNLALGEMDQQRAAHDLALPVDAYMSRCHRKTGALFSVACRLGAVVSDSTAEAHARLTAFGGHVGVAFQIFDDILDISGLPAETGKRRGIDILSGTVTLPLILAMHEDPNLAQDIAAASRGDVSIDALCEHLTTHVGIAAARQRAMDEVARAVQSLDGDVGGADVEALHFIAAGVVDRYA